VQQFIPNLMRIKNRLFHIRQYLVVDCAHGNYLYHNSLYLFAEKTFTRQPRWKSYITSSLSAGFQDSITYKAHALPRDEPQFQDYCAYHRINYSAIRASILAQYRYILNYIQPCRERKEHSSSEMTSRIYGTDVVILADHTTKIIEINNYPSLLCFRSTQPRWQVRIKQDLVRRFERKDYASPHFIAL
jgi:hypothetical protein